MSEFAAIVLAGGAARRMGGAAKPALPVNGVPLVNRVLAAAGAARPRIVVGPLELTALLPAGVSLASEDPPGGGPVAAVAAGVALITEAVRHVALLAADLPFLSPEVLDDLVPRANPAAALVDDAGKPQWLCSVWLRSALVDRLAELGRVEGRAMKELAADVPVTLVPGPAPVWFDCDTEEDLRRAEEWAREHAG